MKTNKTIIIISNGAAVFAAYWLWVFFSYLFVPFNLTPYNIEIKQWPLEGYYKVKPGRYENKKYNTHFTINSKGFRSDEFTKEHRHDFRVIAIGASSTMGQESNDWETWPSRLKHYLVEDGYSVEVINCGIGGSFSSNHLAMLRNELITYSPDLILYYSGRNDHATSNLERYPGPVLYPPGPWHFLKVWAIYKKIQLRFVLLKAFGFDIEPFVPYPNNWTKTYRANLKAIVEETKKAGISFIIVTQMMDYPSDLLGFLSKGVSEETNAQRMISMISWKNKQWYMFMRQIDILRIQSDIAREYNLKIVDLHKPFYESKKNGARLFYDNIHLTPNGNDLIGRSLASHSNQYFALSK